MEKILEDIIKKINIKLKEKGMSQRDFSRKMGKSETWFTALKHVQNDIMLMDLIRACEILDVDAGELLSDNFSGRIHRVSMDDFIKIMVKKECANYLKKNIGNIATLLQHRRIK